MLPKEIAQLVVAEMLKSGQLYVLIVVTAALAAGAAFLARYLERKAENYVTREDFAQLQQQLAASTSLVEGIKSEIQQLDWARREWFSIRSRKLEELVTSLNGCMAVVSSASVSAVTGQFEQGNETFDHAMALAELYFPELEEEVSAFIDECRTFLLAVHDAINADRATGHYDWLSFQPNSNYDQVLQKKASLRRHAGLLLRDWAQEAGLAPSRPDGRAP
jgi:hypothetical protein